MSCFKYYNVPKFTLMLDTAKNTDYTKKRFKQMLSKIKFPSKNVAGHMSISSMSSAGGLQRLTFLKYNVLQLESRFTLGLNTAKNTDYMKGILCGKEIKEPKK